MRRGPAWKPPWKTGPPWWKDRQFLRGMAALLLLGILPMAAGATLIAWVVFSGPETPGCNFFTCQSREEVGAWLIPLVVVSLLVYYWFKDKDFWRD
jgi:hypothetical protein